MHITMHCFRDLESTPRLPDHHLQHHMPVSIQALQLRPASGTQH